MKKHPTLDKDVAWRQVEEYIQSKKEHENSKR